jgi:hypothetical protein
VYNSSYFAFKGIQYKTISKNKENHDFFFLSSDNSFFGCKLNIELLKQYEFVHNFNFLKFFLSDLTLCFYNFIGFSSSYIYIYIYSLNELNS